MHIGTPSPYQPNSVIGQVEGTSALAHTPWVLIDMPALTAQMHYGHQNFDQSGYTKIDFCLLVYCEYGFQSSVSYLDSWGEEHRIFCKASSNKIYLYCKIYIE